MSISDTHHLHSCHYGLFASLLIPPKLSHRSYFILYCVIYESVITDWSPFIVLLNTRHIAGLVGCLSLILQKGKESGFCKSNLASQHPSFSLLPVGAQTDLQ